MTPAQKLDVMHSLIQQAFEGPDFYLPPADVMEDETRRAQGGHFNIIHGDTALRADVYLAGDDPLHRWALERRRRLDLDATSIWVAPAEYVIVRKLEYYRSSGSDRHLRDVATMLRVSPDLLDGEALDEWLARLDLGDAYLEAQGYSEE